MPNFYTPEFSRDGRVFGLDIIRCLAILFVLIDHSLILLPPFFGKDLIREYSGTIGVELFFTLSGFLIGTILLKAFTKNTSFSQKVRMNFWNRRWLRTLPAFIFYFTLYVLVTMLTGYEEFGNPDWKSIISVLFFVQNFLFIQSNYFPISWSLAIEEWFYLLFPLSLSLLSSILKKANTRIFLLAIISFVVMSFMLRVGIFSLTKSGILTSLADNIGISRFQDRLNTGTRKIILLRLDAASYGVLLAFFFYFYKEVLLQRSRFLFALGLLITGVACFLYYDITLSNFNFLSFVFSFPLFGIGFALMLPFIYTVSVNSLPPFLPPFIQNVSIISYSVYLSHSIFLNLLQHWKGGDDNWGTSLVCVGVMLVATYFISVVSYNFIEQRGMALRKAEA